MPRKTITLPKTNTKTKSQPKTSAVEKKVSKLDNWVLNAKQTEIFKTYTFQNFVTALSFTAKITVHAEILGHHPTIELSYGKVKVTLTTHDTKGLTNADFELAQRIDGLRV